MVRRQQWVYRIEPSRFPPDFPERLERFMEAAELSSRGLARLLRVDNRMLRRWRKGTQPDPGHLVALFSLAAERGLLHLFLLLFTRSPPCCAHPTVLQNPDMRQGCCGRFHSSQSSSLELGLRENASGTSHADGCACLGSEGDS